MSDTIRANVYADNSFILYINGELVAVDSIAFVPHTGRQSQTFRIAGKVDGIVRCHDGLYLLEHKTASTIDASYLDKLWTDTQIALYCYYLRELG